MWRNHSHKVRKVYKGRTAQLLAKGLPFLIHLLHLQVLIDINLHLIGEGIIQIIISQNDMKKTVRIPEVKEHILMMDMAGGNGSQTNKIIKIPLERNSRGICLFFYSNCFHDLWF